MQLEAAEPGRRPAQQQFPGFDLRRPKGYTAPPAAADVKNQQAAVADPAAAGEGEPCPRCESRDTKFCYFNNYNTAQPRHFCKGCCRYWTKGGTLRNVPVGGGTRKKPSSSSSSASSSSSLSPTNSTAAKPKRPYKKKRRVAPPEPVASPDAGEPAKKTTTVKTEETTPTADAASEITTELVAPAVAAAAEEDSLAHLLPQPDDATAVALGLGLSDFPTGKGGLLDLEPTSFEWPAAFDLGACWASAGFADPDPALFLNFP